LSALGAVLVLAATACGGDDSDADDEATQVVRAVGP
jgi:hypothetical protein